jgi:predicted DNA binding protein
VVLARSPASLDHHCWGICHGLAAEQYEALQLAVERGSVDGPRPIDREALATDHDVFQQALFEHRQQRQHALIEETTLTE